MTPSRVRALIFVLIFIGGVIVGFFGSRTVRTFRDLREPEPAVPPAAPEAEQAEANVGLIREWMTIPFIAKMYDVPANMLFEALGIPPNRNREKSLRRLNREYFPDMEGIVLEKVRAAVLAALADQPRPLQETSETPLIPTMPTSAP